MFWLVEERPRGDRPAPKPLADDRSSLRLPDVLCKVQEAIANQSQLHYESMQAGLPVRRSTEQ